MKIMDYRNAASQRFDDGEIVKGVTGRVLIGQADGADKFCMRVFEIEPQGFTPRHEHEWEHEVIILAGQGEVLQDGAWKAVTPGTAVFVPGNEAHQFRNQSQAPLVFACLIPNGAPEL